jgi:ABC-type nitrate/sulfonate/bicarbonate transport system permease component
MQRASTVELEPEVDAPARHMSAGGGAFLRGAIGLIALGLLWEIVGQARVFSPLFFVPLSSIAVRAWQMYSSGFIFIHLGYTIGNFALGFLIGVTTGIPLGLLLGWKRRVLQYVDPIISVAMATPIIVLVPLVIVMFGIFWESKVAISAWAVFFPVVVATIAGIQSVDHGLVKVARSFQATETKIILNIVLPGAVPSLMSGLRLGMTKGLIGALAAEFFGSQRGLGYLAFNYSTTFEPDRMFVVILTMAAVGVFITEMLKMMQSRFDAWRPERN